MTESPMIEVRPIPRSMTVSWIVERHYAHRMPMLQYSHGLFIDNVHSGVLTYGPPARMWNNGAGLFGNALEIPTVELNRLVVADDMPENALSQFVGASLRLLPRPHAVVSYADPNFGHHGYIYQATNWLYTGTAAGLQLFINENTGKEIHSRTIVDINGSAAAENLPDWITPATQIRKHRYIYLVGSKRERKLMQRHLTTPIMPYPKGDNRYYETTAVPQEMTLPFDDAPRAVAPRATIERRDTTHEPEQIALPMFAE
jgi:hypothetical protein